MNSIAASGAWQEKLTYKLLSPLFQSPEMGSLPLLYAATDSKAHGGQQYGPRFNFRGYPKACGIAKQALDRDARKRLWDIAVAAYPPYEEYQEKTDRVIPVFLAEPS